MKTLKILFPTLLFCLLFGACEKPESNSPDPAITDKYVVFDTVWATRMDLEKEIVGLYNPQQYKDWFLVGGDFDDPPTILAFNKDTGKKDWEMVLDHLPGFYIINMFVQEHYLLARTGHVVFTIDLNTKQILWTVNLKSLDMNMGSGTIAANGKFYLKADYLLHSPSHVHHIYEFDIPTGKHRIVYSKADDEVGTKWASPPCFIKIDNKDALIFNEYPNSDVGPDKGTQNLIAIDLDTKKELWRVDNFTEKFYSNSLHPPIIYDNRILITGGDWSIYAFDVQTGEQLWRRPFNHSVAVWTKTNHLIHDGRLYVNNSQEEVTCLNPETGEIIWNNPKGGANCTDNMLYYEKENFLVFTSWGYGSVMVLDALTGQTIHREHRYDNSSYNKDVVYDKVRDMFFTMTYRHAIGFKVRRPG